MPELPEVQTTVNGLNSTVIGLRISDVWSDYNSAYFKGSGNIKDQKYFSYFKKQIVGQKIVAVSRRAKNILISLENDKTILIHMKMTGHLMFGKYRFDSSLAKNIAKISAKNPAQSVKQKDKMINKSPWFPVSPDSLKDPFNRHIYFVISFSNNKNLALSDSRKFAKITLIDSKTAHNSEHLRNLGPEPLNADFTFDKFLSRMNLCLNRKIKQAITDQEIIAGIGNIYADESLWRAGIHPEELVKNISSVKLRDLFKAIKQTLTKGIDLGGDSMSDYRNIHGEKGRFQEQHYAYQKTGTKCARAGCDGTIVRIVVGTRSTHLCNKHQRLNS